MKEHGVLQGAEKNGQLNTEMVDNTISKFGLKGVRQEFKKY